MSNQILNDLGGDIQIGFPFGTRTAFQNSIISAYSGKQVAINHVDHDFKNYNITLSVRTREEETEFLDFVNDHMGDYDTFLFLDPKRNFVERTQIGTGDGVELDFQLVNSNGFKRREIQVSPVDAKIWVNNILQTKVVNYNITYYDSGNCRFLVGSVPAVGHVVEAEFYFWRRMRFLTSPIPTNEQSNRNVSIVFRIGEVL